MKFKVVEYAYFFEIINITDKQSIAKFPNGNPDYAEGLAHDYCDFLNDKYHDKPINAEWPKIDREARIKYHEEQIKLLNSDKRLVWNEHGTGVK